MAAPPIKIVWDRAKIGFIVDALPVAAHEVAMLAAAQAAADAIQSKSTGALARDVRVPRVVTALSGLVGSDLPYARIQNEGGTINARGDYLYIHGQRNPDGGSTPRGTPVRREAFPATGRYAGTEITAKVTSVTLDAKRYLDAAPVVYEAVLIEQLRSRFPK